MQISDCASNGKNLMARLRYNDSAEISRLANSIKRHPALSLVRIQALLIHALGQGDLATEVIVVRLEAVITKLDGLMMLRY